MGTLNLSWLAIRSGLLHVAFRQNLCRPGQSLSLIPSTNATRRIWVGQCKFHVSKQPLAGFNSFKIKGVLACGKTIETREEGAVYVPISRNCYESIQVRRAIIPAPRSVFGVVLRIMHPPPTGAQPGFFTRNPGQRGIARGGRPQPCVNLLDSCR